MPLGVMCLFESQSKYLFFDVTRAVFVDGLSDLSSSAALAQSRRAHQRKSSDHWIM